MMDVAFIPYLKTVIASCLAKFGDYTDEVELYKDAVIANAGGIIPMMTFEYHTIADATRHGVSISNAFLHNNIPYSGLATGFLRLTDNLMIPAQSPEAVPIRSSSDSSFDNITNLGNNSYLCGSFIISTNHISTLAVKRLDNGWVCSFLNSLYFFDDNWETTRYMKFDEPYLPSWCENSKVVSYNVNTANTWGQLSGIVRTLYASPYAYVVWQDRTVQYHVD